MKTTRRNTVLAATVFAMAISAMAADDIDVMKAGREDIGAFDDMLARSRKQERVAPSAGAQAARQGFSSVVTGEARKIRDQREQETRTVKGIGQWVRSGKRPEDKGSAASQGDDHSNGTGGAGSLQSVRDKVPGAGRPDGPTSEGGKGKSKGGSGRSR